MTKLCYNQAKEGRSPSFLLGDKMNKEELLKDLQQLQNQALALNGAIQYIKQKIAQLEQEDKENATQERS